jgi:hypothetical protein
MNKDLLIIFSDLITSHASNKQLENIRDICNISLDSTHINIQTLGTILCAANQSTEMSSADNQMSSFLVKGLGEEAQSLSILQANAKFELKQRQKAGK